MNYRKLAVLGACGLLAAAVSAVAQEEKKMEVPKPGPEVKKLGYFLGHWTSEGEMQAGPWGPGGKFTGDSHCSWMSGGYFVVCTEDGTTPMGKMHSAGYLGYDVNAKKYTYNGFNSMGENESATGSVDGKTWTYTSDNMMGGKMIKGRYTITETSATSYDFKLETSADGNTWSSMMTGKVTKAGAMEKKSETKMEKKS